MLKWFIKNRSNISWCIASIKKKLVILIGTLMVCLLVSILTPWMNMELINVFVYEKFGKKHIVTFASYIMIIIISSFISYFSTVYRTKVENEIQERIESNVLSYILKKRVSDFRINEMGNAGVLLKSDAAMYKQFVCTCIMDYSFILIRTAVVFVILVLLNPIVAVAVCVLEIAVTIIQKQLCVPLEKHSQVMRDTFVNRYEVINDIVSNISVIAPIGAKNYLRNKYKARYKEYAENSVRQSKYSAKAELVVDTILSLNVVVVLGIGSYGISSGAMTVGTLLSLVQYVNMFVSSFTSMCKTTIELRSEMNELENISDVLTENRKVLELSSNEKRGCNGVKTLKVSNLDFAYTENEYIFQNANAEFVKGKVNCVCGVSGSGKSTLLKLILGEYNVGESMCVTSNEKGGQKLTNVLINYVPQDNIFFTDTIYNNIALGKEVLNDKVYEVCRDCAIYDEILSQEEGFNTIISNSTINFSGGQVKRISIARAMLQDGDILLLDEPTAGLDQENVVAVFECIKRYANEKLVIVITHDEYIENHSDVVYQLVNKKLQRK